MTALLHPCIGFISQVRCINPLFEIEVQVLRRRGRRRGLSHRQLPVASAVTGLVVRYLAVFNVVSSFYHWCYCYFTIVQHVLCYLAHVDFLMMPVIYHGFTNYVFFLYKMPCQKWRNKTVKSNQSIISYHKHINFLCYIQQNWMKWYISLHVQRGLHSYVY